MKKTSILLLLLSLIAVSPAFAGVNASDKAATQTAVESLVQTIDASKATEQPRLGTRPDGTLRYFGAPAGSPATFDAALTNKSTDEKAQTFLQKHSAAFGVKNDSITFNTDKVQTDSGRTFVRLSQSYAGIPVFAGEAVVQMEGDAGVGAVMAHLMTDTADLDTGKAALTPNVSAADAAKSAIAYVAEINAKYANGDALSKDDAKTIAKSLSVTSSTDLYVYDPSLVQNKGPVSFVWKLTVSSIDAPIAEVVLVDAMTGMVAMSYPLIHTAINRSIRDCDSDGLCSFPDPPVRIEGGLATGIASVDLTYDRFGDAYTYYYYYHGRDSLDNQGHLLDATVRYCNILTLLLYGLTCPMQNAFWNPSDERFVFGEGLETDDILGHEYTHGVTMFESDLVYSNESGAINESLSDVFGEFIDLTNSWGTDTSAVRWLLGEDSSLGVMRDMADPPSYNDPDRRYSSLYYTGTDDYGGVHTNGGVNNKLCYLLTDGDQFRGRTITGMGINTVSDLYYECQVNLLTSGSDYEDLYFALTQAAVNRNLTTAQKANLEKACRAVEIRPTSYIHFNNAAGEPIVQFSDAGDVIMATGAILTQQTISPSSTTDEFIIKNSSGTPVAMIDPTSGNLLLQGDLYEQVSLSYTPSDAVVVKSNGTTVGFINTASFTDPVLGSVLPGSLIISGQEVDL